MTISHVIISKLTCAIRSYFGYHSWDGQQIDLGLITDIVKCRAYLRSYEGCLYFIISYQYKMWQNLLLRVTREIYDVTL